MRSINEVCNEQTPANSYVFDTLYIQCTHCIISPVARNQQFAHHTSTLHLRYATFVHAYMWLDKWLCIVSYSTDCYLSNAFFLLFLSVSGSMCILAHHSSFACICVNSFLLCYIATVDAKRQWQVDIYVLVDVLQRNDKWLQQHIWRRPVFFFHHFILLVSLNWERLCECISFSDCGGSELNLRKVLWNHSTKEGGKWLLNAGSTHNVMNVLLSCDFELPVAFTSHMEWGRCHINTNEWTEKIEMYGRDGTRNKWNAKFKHSR